MAIRIGTSGWVYPHWRGVFYPKDLPQREWFSYYAERFDTVEINNSFYRLPDGTVFDRWREQAPKEFCYAVKASRYLTHLKKLKDPEEPLNRFFNVATHLKTKLGPVLYQLPPRWPVDIARLRDFLSALPRGHRHVFEFRDQSWFVEEIFELLRKHHVAFCIHDKPDLRMPLLVTCKVAYVRFHGAASHGGSYSTNKLREWAQLLNEWDSRGITSFVYFNNDLGGYAIRNALTLKRILASSSRSRHPK